MLQNIKAFYGKSLEASDGDIGHVKDFYFDDHTWAIRYLVVGSESWLTGRPVLLSPHAFGRFDPEGLQVNLTRKQIEGSPSIDLHLPVSRQYEEEYHRYYGWPAYWQGSEIWGIRGYPVITPPSEDLPAHEANSRSDRHLRSTQTITGYHIQTADGTIGHVSGLLIDDKSWAIHEIVVEAGHWYSGKEVLISPNRVERISYEESKVFVNLTKEDILRTGAHHIAEAHSPTR